jgi:hypothetical protein
MAVVILLSAAAAQPRPQGPGWPRPAEPEEVLREAGLKDSPAALAKFFTDRTPKAGTDQVPTLLRQLSSDDPRERQKASEGLLALGPAVAPSLMQSFTEKYGETRRQAKECLARLQARQPAVTCVLAVRELVRVAPERAPAVLLSRLPYAWPGEREAIWLALAKPGRPDALYAKALSDKEAARRALAGFLLARYGTEKEKAAAAALLKDGDRGVRLRVAQGLLGAGSSEGVPALIGLLSKEPETVSWQAEELLRWWAGEDDPKPGGDWAAWWKGKPKVRPAKRSHRPRLVLVREMGIKPSRLSLYGCDGRRRWSLEYRDVAISHPRTAFLSETGTVVAAESQWKQEFVRARDLGGRILWQRPVPPLWVPHPQRMAAGTVNTNIEVLTPWGGLVGPPPPHGRFPRDELPPADGHRLKTEWEAGVVAELDREGRVLWRAEVGGRFKGVIRLPGGGVVAAYHTKDGKDLVEEVGPGGKTGWRAQSGGWPLWLVAPFPLLALGF